MTRDALDAGRGQQRLDVEAEPVRDQGHRNVRAQRHHATNGANVGSIGQCSQRERQHGLAVGTQHRVLRHDRLAKADLASVDRVVVGRATPGRRTRPAGARRHRAAHAVPSKSTSTAPTFMTRGSLSALPHSADGTSGTDGVGHGRCRTQARVRTWPAPRCSRSTDWCWPSPTCPIRRSTPSWWTTTRRMRSAAMEAAEREFVRRSHADRASICRSVAHPGVDEAVRSMGLTRIIERPGMAVERRRPARGAGPAWDRDPTGDVRRGRSGPGGGRGARRSMTTPRSACPATGRAHGGVDGCAIFMAWRGEEPVGIVDRLRSMRAPWASWVSAVVPAARTLGLGSALTVQAARAFPEARSRVAPSQRRGALDVRRLGFRPRGRPRDLDTRAGVFRRRRPRCGGRPAAGRA